MKGFLQVIVLFMAPFSLTLAFTQSQNAPMKNCDLESRLLLKAQNKVDLFTETDEMMINSFQMYTVVKLRKMAELGEIKEGFPALPLSAAQLLGYIDRNKEDIMKSKDFEDDSEETILMLEGLQEIKRRSHESNENSELVQINDDESNKELVYAIGVSPSRKRITVSFRGSVTKKDFFTDLSWWMRDVNNRMKRYDINQPDVIRIHAGFHDYLFGETSLNENEIINLQKFSESDLDFVEGDKLSKFDEIMEFHVIPIMKKYPGYKLYVTGHSLGAALATMFAFRAASIERPEIPKPVICYSIASPYIGDNNYRRAFKLAEQKNLIRHLRVSNHKDLVTIGPFVSLRVRFWKNNPSVGILFKHVGLNLKQYEDGTYELIYPFNSYFDEFRRSWGQSLLSNLTSIGSYLKNHGSTQYFGRIDKIADELKTKYLEELYVDFLGQEQ